MQLPCIEYLLWVRDRHWVNSILQLKKQAQRGGLQAWAHQ